MNSSVYREEEEEREENVPLLSFDDDSSYELPQVPTDPVRRQVKPFRWGPLEEEKSPQRQRIQKRVSFEDEVTQADRVNSPTGSDNRQREGKEEEWEEVDFSTLYPPTMVSPPTNYPSFSSGPVMTGQVTAVHRQQQPLPSYPVLSPSVPEARMLSEQQQQYYPQQQPQHQQLPSYTDVYSPKSPIIVPSQRPDERIAFLNDQILDIEHTLREVIAQQPPPIQPMFKGGTRVISAEEMERESLIRQLNEQLNELRAERDILASRHPQFSHLRTQQPPVEQTTRTVHYPNSPTPTNITVTRQVSSSNPYSRPEMYQNLPQIQNRPPPQQQYYQQQPPPQQQQQQQQGSKVVLCCGRCKQWLSVPNYTPSARQAYVKCPHCESLNDLSAAQAQQERLRTAKEKPWYLSVFDKLFNTI